MFYTGVTRRIDELGRIVIPKDLRIQLSIRTGDYLKIFINNNELILKKVEDNPNYNDYVKNICSQIVKSFMIDIIITDKEKVIFKSNKDFNVDIKIHQNKILSERKEYILDIEENKYYVKPVIINSDVIGIIFIKINDDIDFVKKIVNYINDLIINKMDIS